MEVVILPTKQELGKAAATFAAERINAAIAARKAANILLSTGASQFEMFASLVTQPVDWRRVTVFHLDEYVGLPASHRAGLGRYLKERFLAKLSRHPRAFHFIRGQDDPQAECRRIGGIIRKHPIDVALVGIGENGHLAFNDPPADFDTNEPFIVVSPDETARRQQVGEGWFDKIEDVPRQAVSVSIRQIMASRTIICAVPDERKAVAIRNAVEGELTNMVPASILRKHADCRLFLDPPSASLLKPKA
jgi:glucosamine-6-phosphate deaminase